MTPPYPVKSVRAEFTDVPTLENLYAFCSSEGARVALIGFNEYSKQLVNLCHPNIVGFHDPEPWKHGISFRGKQVLGSSEAFDATHLAVCDYALAYDYAAEIALLYADRAKLHIPPRFAGKATHLIDPFVQEAIYKEIFAEAHTAPLTMMSREKICFMLECLRHSLSRPGDVLEIGVWQGGSAWYLAKLLDRVDRNRSLYLVDPFEQPINHVGTMCNDEIRRRMSFYPNNKMMIGGAADKSILDELCTRRFCFIHCDLGFQHARPALSALWDCMEPGAALLFDNYGHANTRPIQMEKFYAARNARVIRLPWSEQGLVIR